MYLFIESRVTWNRPGKIDENTLGELRLWAKKLESCNGFTIKHKSSPNKLVFKDARDTGYGGYITTNKGLIISRGTFSLSQSTESSTLRELLAIKHVISWLSPYLLGTSVAVHTDSYNAARIIEIGSTKRHLQNQAIEVHNTCVRNDISIQTQWVPRDENQTADAISKINDTDSWSIDKETFDYIQLQHGPFTIDRFADTNNARHNIFNSKFHCPGSSAVNAFTCHWGDEFNWLCPPISLIGRTLRHAKDCKCKGVLFVPKWKSAYYWPLLTPDGQFFYPFVKNVLLLDPYFYSWKSIKSP